MGNKVLPANEPDKCAVAWRIISMRATEKREVKGRESQRVG
jgi:uncharacterized DUF497 family protein